MVMAALGLLISGCQNGSKIVQPQSVGDMGTPSLDRIDIPAGATLLSATMRIYITDPTAQTVTIHRITQPWDEMTVTWNSFAGSYDPTVINSFVPSPYGWHSIDVTGLVQSWLDGTYADYGLVFRKDLSEFALCYSSDYTDDPTLRPKLDVCYTLPSGIACFTIQRGLLGEVADSYVWPLSPDENKGAINVLMTGMIGTAEKYSLLKFNYELLASLGDFVWNDANRNGIQDAGEIGIPNVVVNLYSCAGVLLSTTATNAAGYYLFSNLIPGDYYVVFVPLANYVFSPQDQGLNDAIDSDANVSTGRTICTNLIAGENDLTWDAGLYIRPPQGCTRTIGYWKTHAGFGPGNQGDLVTALLPISLGTPGGTKSLNVTTARMAVRVLSQNYYGTADNGITKLYAQLLGVKLNIASGAGYDDVAAIIAAADIFLATHNWRDWAGLSAADKTLVLFWHNRLDYYNNGFVGPIHCN
jgi:hypothetical protein